MGPSTVLPPTATIPPVGFSNPAMMRRRVDFPHPLGPKMGMNSPDRISKEISSMATIRSPEKVSKTLEMETTFTYGWSKNPPSLLRSLRFLFLLRLGFPLFVHLVSGRHPVDGGHFQIGQ